MTGGGAQSYTERQSDAELYLLAALEFYIADGFTDEQIIEKVRGELPCLRDEDPHRGQK